MMRWPHIGLRIEWNEEKNAEIIRTRGLSFDDVVLAIQDDRNVLDVFPHWNQISYPNQTILVVNVRGYAWAVPFVHDDEKVFLKTIYKSRKLNRIYLSGNKDV